MNKQIVLIGKNIHNAIVDFALEHIDNNKFHCGLFSGFTPDACGACAIGSYFLVQEVKNQLGLRMKFKATNCHVWTEYKNRIYDITATQFSIESKVFSISKSEVYSLEDRWLRDIYLSTRFDDIDNVNETWPRHQRPRDYQLIKSNDGAYKLKSLIL